MMKRLAIAGAALLVAGIIVSSVNAPVRSSRIASAWDARYAATRAAGDCQATTALVLGGLAASYIPADRAWADVLEEGSCVSVEAGAEQIDSIRQLADFYEDYGEPIWATNWLVFEGKVRAQQIAAIFTANDPIQIGLGERGNRDCSGFSSYPALMFNRDLLHAVAHLEVLTVQEVAPLIEAHTEMCRQALWRIVERNEALEPGDWTPGTCDALMWVVATFPDAATKYRYVTECEHGETNLMAGGPREPLEGYYVEQNMMLREAAADGHVLAAREYARLTRVLIEDREAADGPLPARLDPSWIAYPYARRAVEQGVADSELAAFYSTRFTDECRLLAEGFYEQLEAAWSEADVDWSAAARIVEEARACGPYSDYDDRTFEDLDSIASAVPEFARYFDRPRIRAGLYRYELASLQPPDGAGGADAQ